MGNTGKMPRIQVGDATGAWMCRIIDPTLTPKDIQRIHRAIDVEVKMARQRRRQAAREKSINERAALQAAETEKAAAEDAVENDRAAKEAEELENAAIAEAKAKQASGSTGASKTTEPKKAADDVTKTEAEKAKP